MLVVICGAMVVLGVIALAFLARHEAEVVNDEEYNETND